MFVYVCPGMRLDVEVYVPVYFCMRAYMCVWMFVWEECICVCIKKVKEENNENQEKLKQERQTEWLTDGERE